MVWGEIAGLALEVNPTEILLPLAVCFLGDVDDQRSPK